MQKDIILIDLFSGTGGFALGLKKAGYNIIKHYFSEIDKHAIANYKYNFKDAEYIGSITDVCGHTLRQKHPNATIVITFGSPCQDFSLAGKRQGIKGQRSSLIMEAIRLITQIKPSVYIWENVKGTFSSNNGADFWAILNAFTNIGNYRLEWQLLNTSWFLPQNRERIYLVGHLAGSSKPGVFPITEKNQKTNRTQSTQNDKVGTLVSGYGKIPTDGTYIEVKPIQNPDRKQKQQNGRRIKTANEPSFTISATDTQGVFISHYGHKNKLPKTSKIAPTLKAQSHGHDPMTYSKSKIRRLTEIECERLQGFPDNWTRYGMYNNQKKPIAKTQRYKMIGNAVTVDVVKAVAQRLTLTK